MTKYSSLNQRLTPFTSSWSGLFDTTDKYEQLMISCKSDKAITVRVIQSVNKGNNDSVTEQQLEPNTLIGNEEEDIFFSLGLSLPVLMPFFKVELLSSEEMLNLSLVAKVI